MPDDESSFRPMTDGLICLRPPVAADKALLIAGRDDVSRRWLGEGSDDPTPTACISLDGDVVGWVDFDVDHDWLKPGEVNVGYNVFPSHRGRGYATRSVQLLMHHLATRTSVETAALLIDPNNLASLRLAARAGFPRLGTDPNGQVYFARPVPPIRYTDGVVSIRRPSPNDLDADLSAKDDEQIRWLWLPGQRESWEAMTMEQQRAHALRGLEANRAAFGAGPKWTFVVDSADASYVAYVDCDLANEHVPRGEANISYSSHPQHRGKGYASRAVRLAMQFLRDHTAAREAHVIVDSENAASLRVARAVGAERVDDRVNELGRTMVHHVASLRTAGISGK